MLYAKQLVAPEFSIYTVGQDEKLSGASLNCDSLVGTIFEIARQLSWFPEADFSVCSMHGESCLRPWVISRIV